MLIGISTSLETTIDVSQVQGKIKMISDVGSIYSVDSISNSLDHQICYLLSSCKDVCICANILYNIFAVKAWSSYLLKTKFLYDYNCN